MLLSVIMITYNHENFIGEALQSVLLQQTNFSLEVIISDDCSTDNTNEKVSELYSHHPPGFTIRYFKQTKNIGMMQNLIFALSHCNGKYVAICEGDDYWTDPLKLQKQVDILEKETEHSMVITNRSVIYDDGSTYEERYERDYGKSTFTIKDIVNGFMPGTQTIVFRNFSSLPDFLAAHPEFYYGDRYIAYFCSLFGDICLLTDNTAVYRMTGKGVWSANTSLEKLHKYTGFMNHFHNSLGIPANTVLKQVNYNAARVSLRYCLKRPKLIWQNHYQEMIKTTWKKLSALYKLKLILTILR